MFKNQAFNNILPKALKNLPKSLLMVIGVSWLAMSNTTAMAKHAPKPISKPHHHNHQPPSKRIVVVNGAAAGMDTDHLDLFKDLGVTFVAGDTASPHMPHSITMSGDADYFINPNTVPDITDIDSLEAMAVDPAHGLGFKASQAYRAPLVMYLTPGFASFHDVVKLGQAVGGRGLSQFMSGLQQKIAVDGVSIKDNSIVEYFKKVFMVHNSNTDALRLFMSDYLIKTTDPTAHYDSDGVLHTTVALPLLIRYGFKTKLPYDHMSPVYIQPDFLKHLYSTVHSLPDIVNQHMYQTFAAAAVLDDQFAAMSTDLGIKTFTDGSGRVQQLATGSAPITREQVIEMQAELRKIAPTLEVDSSTDISASVRHIASITGVDISTATKLQDYHDKLLGHLAYIVPTATHIRPIDYIDISADFRKQLEHDIGFQSSTDGSVTVIALTDDYKIAKAHGAVVLKPLNASMARALEIEYKNKLATEATYKLARAKFEIEQNKINKAMSTFNSSFQELQDIIGPEAGGNGFIFDKRPTSNTAPTGFQQTMFGLSINVGLNHIRNYVAAINSNPDSKWVLNKFQEMQGELDKFIAELSSTRIDEGAMTGTTRATGTTLPVSEYKVHGTTGPGVHQLLKATMDAAIARMKAAALKTKAELTLLTHPDASGHTAAQRARDMYIKALHDYKASIIRVNDLRKVSAKAVAHATAMPAAPISSTVGDGSRLVGSAGLSSSPSTGTPTTKTAVRLDAKDLTLPAPHLGHILQQVVSDNTKVNRYLLQRQAMRSHGLWVHGHVPIQNYALHMDLSKMAEHNNNSVEIGYDHKVNQKLIMGGYVGVLENKAVTINSATKQDKSTMILGLYGSYQLNNRWYIRDKMSLNRSVFHNTMEHSILNSTDTEIPFNSVNNEIAIGYRLAPSVIVEMYNNTIYTGKTKFAEHENTPSPSGLYNVTGIIKSNIYNNMGVSGFAVFDRSLFDFINLYPYAKVYAEVNTHGRALEGGFFQMGLHSDTEYEKLHEFHYGMTLGAEINSSLNPDASLSISYSVDHYGSDSYNLNFALNYNL